MYVHAYIYTSSAYIARNCTRAHHGAICKTAIEKYSDACNFIQARFPSLIHINDRKTSGLNKYEKEGKQGGTRKGGQRSHR